MSEIRDVRQRSRWLVSINGVNYHFSRCRLEILNREYHAKTDKELLRLAIDSEQLTSEAKAYLTSELAKRGINPEQIRAFPKKRRCGKLGHPKDLNPSRHPRWFREEAPIPSDRTCLLRRLRHRGDRKLWGALPSSLVPSLGPWSWPSACAAWGTGKAARKSCFSQCAGAAGEAAILFFIPDILSRLVAFGAEIAFLLIFPAFMEKEFSKWRATHPSAVPSNSWTAVGWGLVGAVVFLVIAFVVFMVLSVLVPAGK